MLKDVIIFNDKYIETPAHFFEIMREYINRLDEKMPSLLESPIATEKPLYDTFKIYCERDGQTGLVRMYAEVETRATPKRIDRREMSEEWNAGYNAAMDDERFDRTKPKDWQDGYRVAACGYIKGGVVGMEGAAEK